jgi:hypothetical protein
MKNKDIVIRIRIADPLKQFNVAYGILMDELVGMIKIRHDRTVTKEELLSVPSTVTQNMAELVDINVRAKKIARAMGYSEDFFVNAFISDWAGKQWANTVTAMVRKATQDPAKEARS